MNTPFSPTAAPGAVVKVKTTPEVSLCKRGIVFMQQHGWHVDHEVVITIPEFRNRRMVDMIITRTDELGVVEAKTSLTAELIAQLQSLRAYCHLVYALIPFPGRQSKSAANTFDIMMKLLYQHGIGLLIEMENPPGQEGWAGVKHRIKARKNLSPNLEPILDSLATHRNCAHAGSAGVTRWTAAQDRWDRNGVRAYVKQHPGDLAKTIKRALSLARQDFLDLLKLAPDGRIIGIECRLDHGQQRFYPVELERSA